jgi:hypothetical protein
MAIQLTPLMRQRLTRRAHRMIERSLELFPELKEATITVGYTRRHLGSATVVYRNRAITRLIIRLKVRKLSYQTVGHELTHLIQGLARGGRSAQPGKVPAGEQQCDIWTLARHPLFCDDAPTYLKLPRSVRQRWPDYADQVRDLCIAAIEKRVTYRRYIRWLEDELCKLGQRPEVKKPRPDQLSLPFPI